MRRIVTLVALVLVLMAARPATAQSPSLAERLDIVETHLMKLEETVKDMQMFSQELPPPLIVSPNRDTGDILLSGGLLWWAGELPPERTIRFWCKPFDPSGFGNPQLVGLECGWTPAT